MALPHNSSFKIELIRLGLSQRELATRLSISPQYLNDIVQGRRPGRPLISRMVDEIGLPQHLFSARKAA